MECKVCGHKHRVLNDNEDLEYTDTAEFDEIEGSYTITRVNIFREYIRVGLYACPECRTVQISE